MCPVPDDKDVFPQRREERRAVNVRKEAGEGKAGGRGCGGAQQREKVRVGGRDGQVSEVGNLPCEAGKREEREEADRGQRSWSSGPGTLKLFCRRSGAGRKKGRLSAGEAAFVISCSAL